MPRWLTADQQRAWRGLMTMTSRLNAQLNRELQAAGLSLSDYEVLVALSEAADGQLRLFELASAVCWEQSRLSHHCTRMQKRGLVHRRECPSDGRGAFLVLTPAGREAIEHAAPGHAEAVQELVFDGLGPAQVDALTQLTDAVLQRLEARAPGG